MGLFAPTVSIWPKISGKKAQGVAITNRSSCQKTKLNDLSCGIRMWAQCSFVLSQLFTRSTDGQTDRQTDGKALEMVIIMMANNDDIMKTNEGLRII